jgi:hypothetical protein
MIIPAFNPDANEVQFLVAQIMMAPPVMHLRPEEVKQTIRLLQLEDALADSQRTSHYSVTVYQDDCRLQHLTDDDKFLALLLDADCRQTILTSKRCHYCFGGTPYHWQKVARRCELIETKSATMEATYGGRFLGRGWALTPYIQRLRKWMKENNMLLK